MNFPFYKNRSKSRPRVTQDTHLLLIAVAKQHIFTDQSRKNRSERSSHMRSTMPKRPSYERIWGRGSRKCKNRSKPEVVLKQLPHFGGWSGRVWFEQRARKNRINYHLVFSEAILVSLPHKMQYILLGYHTQQTSTVRYQNLP